MIGQIEKLKNHFETAKKTKQAVQLARVFYAASPFGPERADVLQKIVEFGETNPGIVIPRLPALPERRQSIHRDFSLDKKPLKYGTREEDRYRERGMFIGLMCERNLKGLARQLVEDRCNALDDQFYYMGMPVAWRREDIKRQVLAGTYLLEA